MSTSVDSNESQPVQIAELEGQVPELTIQPKKHILLNAFDMSGTLGHLSPGQWKV
jgi:hypothetical protein